MTATLREGKPIVKRFKIYTNWHFLAGNGKTDGMDMKTYKPLTDN